MRAFVWASALGWGIAVGAKLFDLLVLAGAWSASPPGSFALLPYGPRWPVDPGDFFQPLMAILLIAMIGGAVTGWRAPRELRVWLLIPLGVFLVLWAVTPTIFWPMIRELNRTARGAISRTEVESIALARRWVLLDAMRTALLALGFIAALRALSSPAASVPPPPTSP